MFLSSEIFMSFAEKIGGFIDVIPGGRTIVKSAGPIFLAGTIAGCGAQGDAKTQAAATPGPDNGPAAPDPGFTLEKPVSTVTPFSGVGGESLKDDKYNELAGKYSQGKASNVEIVTLLGEKINRGEASEDDIIEFNRLKPIVNAEAESTAEAEKSVSTPTVTKEPAKATATFTVIANPNSPTAERHFSTATATATATKPAQPTATATKEAQSQLKAKEISGFQPGVRIINMGCNQYQLDLQNMVKKPDGSIAKGTEAQGISRQSINSMIDAHPQPKSLIIYFYDKQENNPYLSKATKRGNFSKFAVDKGNVIENYISLNNGEFQFTTSGAQSLLTYINRDVLAEHLNGDDAPALADGGGIPLPGDLLNGVAYPNRISIFTATK